MAATACAFLTDEPISRCFIVPTPTIANGIPQTRYSWFVFAKTAFIQWEPTTNQIIFIYAPAHYSEIEFGPYKGNLSQDGSHLVLRSKTGALVAFAYDLSKKQKYPDIPLGSLPGKNGYCGISTTSRYVACFQTTSDGTDTAHIFTIEGTPINIGPSTTVRATAT